MAGATLPSCTVILLEMFLPAEFSSNPAGKFQVLSTGFD